MKLHVSILEKCIELPMKDMQELRHLLDDIGLEVKGVEGSGSGTIFNIETLANRGDTLSALGAARELSARLLTAVKIPAAAMDLRDRKSSTAVHRDTPQCLRYALLELTLAREMKLRSDIAAVMGGGTPDRHPIIDTLNYIQLEIGQPMHAFDREKVEGDVTIDALAAEESVKALDGKTYKVPAGSIVIRDRKKIIAVAGVIGCENTMVTPGTTRVLVESAAFDPVSVRLTRRGMNISTDASYAFERGSDVDNVLFALQRLVHLTGSAGGATKDGNSAQVVGISYAEGAPVEKRKIPFSISTIRNEMNLPRLNDVEITTRLKYLGFGIEPAAEELKFKAAVPSWRLWDVQNPEDITEEIARVHGYNKVKLELPPLDYDAAPLDPTEILLEKLEPVLHGAGFTEVITKGFSSADDVRLVSQVDSASTGKYVGIRNAVESNYSHLKLTNILQLARVCEQNLRRGVESVKIYEFGRLFARLPRAESRFEFERDTLTLSAAGRWNDTHWRKPEDLQQVFFSMKGVLESACSALNVTLRIAPSSNPLLHPGMQGILKVGRAECGVFGLIHPLLQEKLDLSERMVYAELDAEKLCAVMAEREYHQAIDLPLVWRDITVKIAARAVAGDTMRWIEEIKPANLTRIHIVDNFKKQDEAFRRVSYRLIFQNAERTLEGGEVDTEMKKILAHLKATHDIELAA